MALVDFMTIYVSEVKLVGRFFSAKVIFCLQRMGTSTPNGMEIIGSEQFNPEPVEWRLPAWLFHPKSIIDVSMKDVEDVLMRLFTNVPFMMVPQPIMTPEMRMHYARTAPSKRAEFLKEVEEHYNQFLSPAPPGTKARTTPNPWEGGEGEDIFPDFPPGTNPNEPVVPDNADIGPIFDEPYGAPPSRKP
jgi:hypothetical protein